MVTIIRGAKMSYVNPNLRTELENLPIDLKNKILSMKLQLNTIEDLNNAVLQFKNSI